ncbi:leucine-rich repeat-containing protein 61-like [Ptychodera flava]|uniref:leucine-rich repeat-containing protein 61-like n=1 Tax=Ptychodera flava TaxID=63121 RepID=UPI003969C2E3
MAGAPENGRITRQMLKTKSGEFDLGSIPFLILRRQGIDDLGCLGECTNLQTLDLSYNDISRLQALATLKQLTHLNLAANRIASLEPLKELESLLSLNIAGNLIGSTDSLRCLTHLEDLESLRLVDSVNHLTNPVCHSTSYKHTVMVMFPRLKTLDGERVSGRGSELFRICQELDIAIQSNSPRDGPIKECQIPAPIIAEGFWDIKPADNTAVREAEKQLQDVLAECRKLHKQADDATERAHAHLQNNGTNHES